MRRALTYAVTALVMALGVAATAQVDKSQLFRPAEEAIAQASQDGADLLAPRLLEEAKKKLEEARRDFDRGKNLNRIQKKIDEAASVARRAREVAQMGRLALKDLLLAREAASKAEVGRYAPRLAREAERAFADAVKVLEYGDLEEARSLAERGTKAYREAELVAIKARLLGKARLLREQAEKAGCAKIVPISYQEGETYLEEAEKVLDNDRYAEDQAAALATSAERAFRHAIALKPLIESATASEEEAEQVIRRFEAQLSRVAAEFEIEFEPEQAPEQKAEAIVQAIRKVKAENEKLLQSLSEREKAIAELRDKIHEIEQRHASLAEQLEEQKRQIEAQRIREAKIRKITNMFAPGEAEVLMAGRDLVIRLYGLSFPVGRATIDPQYFALLAKVQQAIREFPDAHVTVEGHTDSQGDEKSNQRLSFERANAVRQYLLANMGLPEDRVSAIGYGESRPIASNETAEGRAKNRRIEIVLTLP